jgi:hypothetical protein
MKKTSRSLPHDPYEERWMSGFVFVNKPLATATVAVAAAAAAASGGHPQQL